MPDEVIGDPDTEKILGNTRPTEVTVPDAGNSLHVGTPKDRVRKFPFVPAAT